MYGEAAGAALHVHQPDRPGRWAWIPSHGPSLSLGIRAVSIPLVRIDFVWLIGPIFRWPMFHDLMKSSSRKQWSVGLVVQLPQWEKQHLLTGRHSLGIQ